jgi:hypothetical protein|tara:strand:+ start:92 stop:886 length:795 start_codon:yes stop_codon:yes gene_type:complete
MGTNTKLDKGVIKRGIITPDKHFPLHCRKAIDIVCQAIRIIKPDFYVDLGDVGEFESVSHWQWKKKKRPPLEYQLPRLYADLGSINAGMDTIDEALDKANVPKRYFCEGNHEEWLNVFSEENSYLQGLRVKDALLLEQRGYNYYPSGEYLKIGHLWFYHGHHFAGIHHTRNHLLRLGVNIMYGHHHDMQQTSVTQMDGPKSAWSIGCLKDMSSESNSFLGRRKTNWAHGFAVVDYYDDNRFTVHPINIIDGVTSLWGRRLSSNA